MCADIYYLAFFSSSRPDKPNIGWALRDSIRSLYLLRVRKLLILTKNHHTKNTHSSHFFFNRYVFFCFSDISPIISCLLFFFFSLSICSYSLCLNPYEVILSFFLTLCPYVCVCGSDSLNTHSFFVFSHILSDQKKKIDKERERE